MNASQKIAVAVVALAATVALPLSARFLATGTTVTGGPRPAATTVAPPPPTPAGSDACDPDDGTPCPPSWAPFHDVDGGHHDCFIAVGPTSVLWCGLPRVFITTS